MFILKYWNNFYRYTGKTLLLILPISALIGILDGFGITLVIPLLESKFPGGGSSNISIFIRVKEMLTQWGVEPSFINLLLFILSILLFKNILRFTYMYLNAQVSSRFIKKVRYQILNLTKGMDYQYYIKTKTGHLLNTTTSDAFRYATTQQAFIISISSFFILGGYILLLFLNSWKVSLIILIIGFGISYLYKWLNQLAKKYSRKVVEYNKDFNSKIIETITYFKYLKATGRFSFFYSKLSKNIDENAILQFKTGIANGMPAAIQEPVTLIIIFFIFLLNSLFLNEPLSSILVVLAISYRVSGTLSQFQSSIQRFYSGIGSLEAVNDLIKDLKNNQEPKNLEETDINSFKTQIQLQQINFSYGDDEVLNNLSLVIPKNKTVALVGASGAGKSTLVDIFCGLLKPQSGRILIDGNHFTHLACQSWREKIGYITQENIVFDGSVKENICLQDNKDALNANFKNALYWSNADEFVEKLPNKYETLLGERGIRLSGGQRQRIAIARELNKMPEILIMDEATSALDSDSEKIIQDSIDRLKGKFTVIIIAHRLATIKNADFIYVLKAGKIVEVGDFPSLLADINSLLYKMASLQQLV